MKYICIACGKEITEKDTIGINKKLLGKKAPKSYPEFQRIKYRDHDKWSDMKKAAAEKRKK